MRNMQRNTHEVKWKQLTLGHLSRNKFWGEDPDTQYHSVVASSTLVQDGSINILVDPTLPVDAMEHRLQQYCGLSRNDIDIIFATHFHTDHRLDAEKYPNAKLYMSAESIQDVADLRKKGGLFAQIFLNGAVFDFEAAPPRLTPGVEVHPLPGHTLGLAGLTFTGGGKKILLSGDTIMNSEFYHAREGYYIDASQQKTTASMNWAAEHVDIIVPGHGDWFFTADSAAGSTNACTWRKLNLCADGEETAVLVQTATENILINPTMPGHLLREALYDAKGLEPTAITRVICLKNDAQHMLDVPIMRNAQLYLPKAVLEATQASAQADAGRLHFSAWQKTSELPIDIAEIGSASVCIFNSGAQKVAVASEHCDKQSLCAMGVTVAILGGEVCILQ